MTIKETVDKYWKELQDVETHNEFLAWAHAHGINSKVGYTKLKVAWEEKWVKEGEAATLLIQKCRRLGFLLRDYV